MRKYKITVEGEYGDARFSNTKIKYYNISPIGAGYVLTEIKSKVYKDIIGMNVDGEYLNINNFNNLFFNNDNKAKLHGDRHRNNVYTKLRRVRRRVYRSS